MSKKSQKRYRVFDDELFKHIDNLDPKEQSDWLFLGPHPQFAGRWLVEGIDSNFYFDFKDLIGSYRTVSPASLQKFLDYADELEYEVVFLEDPFSILDAYEHLNDPPAFKLNSTIDVALDELGEHHAAEVVRQTGMLPFQVQGFNFLRRYDIRGGLALWSTGTGKTALEAALIKQHMEVEQAFDLALVVVKSNNKYDTQKKLRQLGSIESFIIEGTIDTRDKQYGDFNDILDEGIPLVGITNYEKFRDDEDLIAELVAHRRLLAFFDEMPTKLRNRETQLYQAVNRVLYEDAPKVAWDKLRPSAFRSYQLTATPIENSPLDQLNCIRLQDPDVFPTIKGWEKRYVASRNRYNFKPETFHNLEEMGLKVDFMTHQVDKEDPDIAKMFPEVREETRFIDWHPADRVVYDKMQDIAAALIKEAKEDPSVKKFNALQLFSVLQMLCDAPSMVQKSAENREEFEAVLSEMSDEEQETLGPAFISGSEAALTLLKTLRKKLTDEHCTKLEALREILVEKHPNEKIVIFSRLASYIQPILEQKFQEWGLTYVIFRGTDRQRQEAKERFQNDPNIQIFLSSDTGSDSIDLPEASVAIDYDLPFKWSTKTQRRNRIHRVNSTHKYVTFYTLVMANSVEERFLEIIERKHGYHLGIFKGEMSDDAISARMTAEDLEYILTGSHNDDSL